MEPYQKSLLEQIAKQTEENNKMLHSIRSYIRWARFYGFVKFVIIVLPLVAAYYYISPHLSDIEDFTFKLIDQVKTVEGLSGQVDQLKSATDSLHKFDSFMKTMPKIQQ